MLTSMETSSRIDSSLFFLLFSLVLGLQQNIFYIVSLSQALEALVQMIKVPSNPKHKTRLTQLGKSVYSEYKTYPTRLGFRQCLATLKITCCNVFIISYLAERHASAPAMIRRDSCTTRVHLQSQPCGEPVKPKRGFNFFSLSLSPFVFWSGFLHLLPSLLVSLQHKGPPP